MLDPPLASHRCTLSPLSLAERFLRLAEVTEVLGAKLLDLSTELFNLIAQVMYNLHPVIRSTRNDSISTKQHVLILIAGTVTNSKSTS